MLRLSSSEQSTDQDQSTQESKQKNWTEYQQIIFKSLNVSTALFIIILVNTFTIKKYINRATSSTVQPELVYLSISLGLLYSAIFSGKLNLIKNISLSQLFMLSYLIQVYGFENTGIVCFSLALYLAIFMGLKLQFSYKFIPRCVLVGAKISMNVLLILQQLFQLNLEQKPPFVLTIQTYFNFFIQNFLTFPYSLMVVYGSLLVWIYLIQKKFRNFPFIFVLFIGGIIYGYVFNMYSPIETIKDLNLPDVYSTLYDHLAGNLKSEKPINYSLLLSPNFILHTGLYSLLVFIEFIISISLLKHNSKEDSQCEKEIQCMIAANLFHGLVGLLPVSAGFDINMQIGAIKGHQKKFYVVSLVMLALYPVFLNILFNNLPILMLSTLFGSLAILSHKETDFTFLWTMNKKSFAFIFVMIFIAIQHETCLSVFYATVIYYMFYLRSVKSVVFYKIKQVDYEVQFEENNPGMKADEDELETIQDEDRVSLVQKQVPQQRTNIEKGIVYTFYGVLNPFLMHIHLNNLLYRKEDLVFVNFKEIACRDADFLSEYYEIIKLFEQTKKRIFIVGFNKKYFEEYPIYDQAWILDYYRNGKIIFLENCDTKKKQNVNQDIK